MLTNGDPIAILTLRTLCSAHTDTHPHIGWVRINAAVAAAVNLPAAPVWVGLEASVSD